MDIVTGVSNALSSVQRLREISRNVAEAEFKNLLADLASELADVKLEAANLKAELVRIREENRVLRETTPPIHEKPTGTKWGCYQFEGEDGLYCTACWDSKRRKSRTSRLTSNRRMCPVCEAIIGS